MAKSAYYGPLEQVTPYCWRIPKTYKQGMRVDGLIYADEEMIETIRNDQAPEQVANVAFLPGIQHASLAMPDIHWAMAFALVAWRRPIRTRGGYFPRRAPVWPSMRAGAESPRTFSSGRLGRTCAAG